MSSAANVLIHSSQFPENVRRDLLESLRSRKVNHKFHYDSIKQTQKWLALHQRYSPSRKDVKVPAIYEQSFAVVARTLKSRQVHLIGLGCGGGRKDTHCLKRLKRIGRKLFYTPSDVSTAMVLVAREAALKILPEQNCFPFVCDLVSANDLPAALAAHDSAAATRLFTFFGMIPNFEPEMILPKLAALIRPGDRMLFSANLAPGPDYTRGVRRILPQYDNDETREWLITFLLDLGVERSDGKIKIGIVSRQELQRVEARFYFTRDCEVSVEGEQFSFAAGESIRLFFSYRYTPALVREILGSYRLKVDEQWIAASEEEGVFLISNAPSRVARQKTLSVSSTALIRGTSWVRNKSVLPKAASTAKKGSAQRTSAPK